MAKSRGGQKKHWAEVARLQVWYAEIKRRSDLSNYALDYKFAWTEEGLKSRRPEDDRPRIFEGICEKSRKPKGRDKRWRNMEQLVIAVEQEPGFSGTQSLYEAELWNLLQEEPPTPDAVEERIDRLLEANGLVREPMEKVLENIESVFQELDPPSIFDRCLRLSFLRMDRLSRIALAWSLYLQTESPHNASFRAKILSIADDMLDHFFADHLPDQHFRYYGFAVNSLLRARLNLPAQKLDGYGFIEKSGRWLVVPKGLLGKVTETELIPERDLSYLWGSNPVRSI